MTDSNFMAGIIINDTFLKLQVVSGDIFSVESLEPHVQDADVVMSTLGFPTTAPVV